MSDKAQELYTSTRSHARQAGFEIQMRSSPERLRHCRGDNSEPGLEHLVKAVEG